MAVASAPARHSFVAGKSPFRVKGGVYRNLMQYLDGNVEHGREALFALVLADAPLGAFARQPFLAGTFYDALPTVPLCEAAAQLVGKSFMTFVREFSRYTAEHDARGVYRMLLRLVSPQMVMERTPAAAKQYFDFVDVAAEKTGPKSYRTTVRGVPRFVAPFYQTVTEAYLSQALTLAGGKEPLHAWGSPMPDGDRDGISLVRLVRDVSWR